MQQNCLECTPKRSENGKEKELSSLTELQEDSEDMIYQQLCSLKEVIMNLREELLIAESAHLNNLQILIDKLNSCKNYFQTTKLSQTSARVLTLIDPGYESFWSSSVQELSDILPLAIKTDLQGLDLKYLKNSLKSMDAKSSSSITSILHQKKSWSKISSLLQHLSVQECMGYVSTGTKCQMIKIYKRKLTPLWKTWMNLSMKMYNSSIDCLKSQEFDISQKFELKDHIKKLFKEEIRKTNIPNTSVEYSVFDAILAYKASDKAVYRTWKTNSYSIALDGRNIKNGFIYKNNTYKYLNTKYGINRIESKNFKIINLETVNTTNVCRLIFKPNLGQFYISIPIKTHISQEIPERDIIALDPGVRSFLAFYDGNSAGEIGKDVHINLKRLNKQIDRLKSKKAKTKKSWRKYKYKKAIAKIQERISNIVKDLHYKACNFLKQYKTILLPTFKVKSMISGKNKYKLSKHTKRSLLDLSHFKFKMRLIQKTSETRNRIIICNEAFTSKTCTNCGSINNVGKKKDYSCNSCKLNIDRDINGARNIMLRVLRGGSTLLE